MFALSPGGRYVAVPHGDEIAILNTDDGETVGTLPGLAGEPTALSFSPDGATLAALGSGLVQGWDLAEGKALPRIALAPLVPLDDSQGWRGRRACELKARVHRRANAFRFLIAFDGHAALAGGVVFDLTTGARRQSYRVPWSSVTTLETGRILALGKGGPRDRHLLSVWPVPEPPRGGSAASASVAVPAQLLLSRGDTVTLDLRRLKAKSDEKKALTEALTAQLTDRGVSIADDQPVRVVVTTTTENEKRTYQTARGRFGQRDTETVNVQRKTTRLAIEADDQVAWERITTVSPSYLVTLREGQSIADAVRGSATGSGVSLLLKELELPELIPDPRALPPSAVTLKPGGYGK